MKPLLWNGETLTVSIFNFGKALELVSLLVLGISLSRKETKTAVVCSCFPFIRSGQNHLTRHSESGKKTRLTDEGVGRERHEINRPGVRQVPEGSGEHRKMEETGCEIICGSRTTLSVKALANKKETRPPPQDNIVMYFKTTTLCEGHGNLEHDHLLCIDVFTCVPKYRETSSPRVKQRQIILCASLCLAYLFWQLLFRPSVCASVPSFCW